MYLTFEAFVEAAAKFSNCHSTMTFIDIIEILKIGTFDLQLDLQLDL